MSTTDDLVPLNYLKRHIQWKRLTCVDKTCACIGWTVSSTPSSVGSATNYGI